MSTSLQRINVIRVIIAVAIALSSGLLAQTPARFEVASVRPNGTPGCQGRWDFTEAHGRLTVENTSLRRLVSRAYELTEDRVSGPDWIESHCYDIAAKAEGDSSTAETMKMLQTLIQERFHLVTHRESQEKTIFALLADKNGAKIHEYKSGDKIPVPSGIGAGRAFFMVSGGMATLAERLGTIVGRPVVDRTGLTGNYKIALSYAPANATDPDGDIFSAIREQLGLRLEATRGTVEILKIDSADKIPIEN